MCIGEVAVEHPGTPQAAAVKGTVLEVRFIGAEVIHVAVLYLYLIAEYNTETKLYNTIHYKSLDELAARINEKAGGESRVSKATLSRFLNDPGKTTFFEIDKDRKVIILKNDFKRKNKEEESRPFVILNEREFDFLIVQN